MKSDFSVRSMCLCALFAALIAVGAFLKIPLPLNPITLQTLFVMLAGLLLGKKNGVISCTLYVIIGLAGLPIFSQGGGIGYVLNPTFGYLIGFIIGTYVIGVLSENHSSFIWLFLSAAIGGIAVVYIFGAVYYYLLAKLYLKNTIAISALMMSFVIVPLPGDLLSALLAALLAKRLRKVI